MTSPQGTGSRGLVAVTGANGFVGRAVLRALQERGYGVRALVRTRGVDHEPSVEIVLGDIRDPAAVAELLRGADAVVHLAALKADQPESFSVNVEGARNLIERSRMSGVARIVNVSTQAATYAVRDRYGDSKAAADRIFADSGLDVVTLVPSLIYGEDPTGVFSKIVHFVHSLPVVPVIGSGEAVFQPIHVEDVAEVIVACIEARSPGAFYEVGGPDALTFDGIIDAVQRSLGTSKRKVHLPWLLCLLAARVLRLIMKSPPLTVSNILGASSANTALLDVASFTSELGVQPRNFQSGLMQVLAPQQNASVEVKGRSVSECR